MRANYGTDIASLSYYSADEPISFETIAHWPVGLEYMTGQPAFLGWSLYPGHTCYDVNTFDYYGEDISWVNYVVRHDIDPSVATPPANRNNSFWLNPNFYYTQAIADGRVVDYDFSSITGWNGNLDMDMNVGENPDDKFPARVRLYTDYAAYDDWFDTTLPVRQRPDHGLPEPLA